MLKRLFLPLSLRATLAALALAALVLMAAACSSPSNRDVADQAVTEFHHQLDGELYSSIILNASDEMKSPSLDMENYLKRVHDLSGKTTDLKFLTSSSQVMGDQVALTMVYKASFEREAGMETFVFRMKDGHPRLVSYDLKGPRELNRD